MDDIWQGSEGLLTIFVEVHPRNNTQLAYSHFEILDIVLAAGYMCSSFFFNVAFMRLRDKLWIKKSNDTELVRFIPLLYTT